VRYASLYRQMLVEQSMYETLTKQYEMAKVEEARDLPTVRVLDQANLPEKKSWPKRTLLVLAGCFLTFIFSCAYVFARDWWESSNSPWRNFACEVTQDMKTDLSRFRRSRKTNKEDQQRVSQVQ